MNVRSLLVCALLVLPACAPRLIPGTNISDTEDTRAILGVMENYRAAFEHRDAKAIEQLVSPAFRDNSGTEDLSDDLTADNLSQALPALFARLDAPQVQFEVRSVAVNKEGIAQVIYYWNTSWRAPTLLERTQRDSELEQMTLEKKDGKWLIVSGI